LYAVPEQTVEALAGAIQKRLKIGVLRVVGERGMKVTKVAMVPGASGPVAHRRMLQRDDVEVVVIGEVPEWETIEYVADAAAQGKRKALILMGHIPSEQAGMDNCATWLKGFIKDVKVGFVPTAEPFWMPR
jgi:putative NIF3 family GTP cyclohydrolase 1 type 2